MGYLHSCRFPMLASLFKMRKKEREKKREKK